MSRCCHVSRACDVAEGEVGDDPLLAVPPQVELGELPGGEHNVVVGEHGALHTVCHMFSMAPWHTVCHTAACVRVLLHLGVAGGAGGVAEAGALVGRDVRQPGVERLVGLDQSEVSMVTGWPGLRQSQLTWARPSSIGWRQDMTPSSATSSPAA